MRSQAIEFVRATYGRELKVGEVRVQPFKLQLEVRDLAFPDDDGQTMLGFERLFADFELSSLWKRAWYFRDVQLDAPVVRAVVRPRGALNLGDLAIEEPPGTPPAEPEPLPSVWIATLDVSKGVVDFLDRARSRPFERRFSPVAFGLKEFRTTPEGGDFRLTAQSEAAEKFDWKGRFALAPVISSSGDFTVEDVRAAGVGEFLGDALPFELTDGLIDLNGHYAFKLGETTDLDLQLPAIDDVRSWHCARMASMTTGSRSRRSSSRIRTSSCRSRRSRSVAWSSRISRRRSGWTPTGRSTSRACLRPRTQRRPRRRQLQPRNHDARSVASAPRLPRPRRHLPTHRRPAAAPAPSDWDVQVAASRSTTRRSTSRTVR